MNPLVTLTSATAYRDGLGVPVFGPLALLRDLELRLGIPTPEISAPARIRSYALRIEAAAVPFLARSFAVDRLGTAGAVLALREALVEAGWDGSAIPGGGPRLDAIAAIEAVAEPALLPGPADRLVAVERELRGRLYETITLLPEEEAIWPARWRRVFPLVAELRTWTSDFSPAPASCDLARLQRGERGGLAGDGSVVLLRAETSLELAEAVAAEIAGAPRTTTIVRGGDPGALDLALAAQGLPVLGDPSETAFHPALQLLPLALELELAPRDPRRAIDLLLLPSGPIRGYVGRRLAATLSRWPSVGGPRWEEAKKGLMTGAPGASTQLSASGVDGTDGVEEWLEGTPAYSLPIDRLVARVRQVRAALSDAVASAQARELEDALLAWPKATLSRLDLHSLLRSIPASARSPHAPGAAGRAEPIDDPRLALRPRPQVIWWCFVDPRPPASPWRKSERRALAACGIHLPEDAAVLEALASGWRRPVLAARERLVLALPARVLGARMAPHPLWDELLARAGATENDVARITRRLGPPRQLPLAALPPARAEWSAPAELLSAATRSPKSIQTLVECPLQWALHHQAKLQRKDLATLSGRATLQGDLAHRLSEELIREGHFDRGAPAVAAAAPAIFERLVDAEASHLRLSGMSFDLQSLGGTLRRAAHALAHAIERAQLRELKAEVPLEGCTWRGAELAGRIDLTGVRPDGRRVVIDLKRRSAQRLREELEHGRAVQLAAYAFAVNASTAYFSVTHATLLTTNAEAFGGSRPVSGPSDEQTWARVGETVGRLEALLSQGHLPATGVEAAPDLAEMLGGQGEALLPLMKRNSVQSGVCEHCAFAPICGRQWEELS